MHIYKHEPLEKIKMGVSGPTRRTTRKRGLLDNKHHKLNFILAQEIRKKYATKQYYQYELAKEYGITSQCVSAIVRNETHVSL